jgi:molybdate transport system permease protein
MITELGKLDWSPLFISLKTGAAATVVAFFAGILLSWRISRAGQGVKGFVDGVLTLPIVLPPTVAGFILLLVFSTRRPVGEFLWDNFNIKIIQSWLGCVVAAFVISFPLMYRNARAAFEQVDKNLIYAARTLGMSEFKILIRVVVPAASPGLISGTVLTFARAMGEYGATSMLAGNIPGKTATISQKIAMVIQDGNYTTAGIWVVIVTIISLVIIIATNAVLSKLMRR